MSTFHTGVDILSRLGCRVSEPAVTRLISKALESGDDLVSLAVGFTDNAMLPDDMITDIVKELNEQEGLPVHLQYGTTQGRPGLRELIIQNMLSYPDEYSEHLKADNVMIGNGSQQVLYLLMQVIANRHDIVYVEMPTYFVFLDLLKGMGIDVRSLPMRDDGSVDTLAFRRILDKHEADGTLSQVKAVYLVSYFSNPSSRSMTTSEKIALGEVLRKVNFQGFIIEDACYRDFFFYEPHHAPSILSLPVYEHLRCMYTSTFTKPFSSGLRTGYGICSDKTVLKKMIYVKGHHDFGSNHFAQAIIEKALETRRFHRWMRELPIYYRQKAELFRQVVKESDLKELGWRWQQPKGGMMAWLEGPKHLVTSLDSPFYRACVSNGVLYLPGDLCTAEGEPKNYVRLSVASPTLEDLDTGLRRFIEVARSFSE